MTSHPFTSDLSAADTCIYTSPVGAVCRLPAAEHASSRPRRARPPPPEHRPFFDNSGLDECIFTTDGVVCGLPASRHRPSRHRPGRPQPPDREDDREGRHRPGRYESINLQTIVGIDGEGQGRAPHLYTYLAAVGEDGELRGEIHNSTGLDTKQCLDFFLDLGVSRVFGFAIGYDLTKILSDLPDEDIYLLNRPELRKMRVEGANGIVRTIQRSVDWRGFRMGYMRGQFTVRRIKWDAKKNRNVTIGPSVVLWDVFRFFQSKFTKALIDWGIADKKLLERMERMKALRATFDKLSRKEIEDYCKEECHYLAKLVRQLIQAHDDCDLKLKYFYGAGSTATALLQKLEIKQYLGKPPPEMRDAIARAFYGGRFEVSRVGPVFANKSAPIYNFDISSAYPYHITHLPCLSHECGNRWEHVTDRRLLRRAIATSRLALVHALPRLSKHAPDAWGPLPWRSPKGTIVFPKSSGGVWTWKDEYLAAERIFPAVEATEAWVYHQNCEHKPFEKLPEIYAERVRIGKEGRGIVLKLGPNSIYGKTAQSLGSAPFQSFVWAGNITSNTRAQLLEAAFGSLHPDEWWNVLMFATDGIFSTCPLTLPAPKETGTGELPNEKGQIVKKPLGGWETTTYPQGIFLLRPGIYFPLDPTEEDIKNVKARGMSKTVLLENARTHVATRKAGTPDEFKETVEGIQEHYARTRGEEPFKVTGLERFVGMKTGVLQPGKKPAKRSSNYGEWIDYPIIASFTPLPKRARVLPGERLEMFPFLPGKSEPYKRANLDPEAQALREAEAIFADQPEGDFAAAGMFPGLGE